jgi:hypothetical protein
VLRFAFQIATGSRPSDPRWDVSGDGSVTSLDALMILQGCDLHGRIKTSVLACRSELVEAHCRMNDMKLIQAPYLIVGLVTSSNVRLKHEYSRYLLLK